MKLKLEEQIVQLLKELSSENADLQRQLDNVRSLLTDSHVQVSNKDSLMSSILKSKSDEKVRLLSEIQLLREQLYQKRIHGGLTYTSLTLGIQKEDTETQMSVTLESSGICG